MEYIKICISYIFGYISAVIHCDMYPKYILISNHLQPETSPGCLYGVKVLKAAGIARSERYGYRMTTFEL